MAKHELSLGIAHPIPVGNVDLEIAVRKDDKAMGKIKISKGAIDWIPSPNSKKGFWLDWTDFATVMEKHGNSTN